MKESTLMMEKTRELLDQVEELRKHAWEDQTPWAVGLRMLEEEVRGAFNKQMGLLKSYEDRISELQRTARAEKEKLVSTHETERTQREERLSVLQARIGEMEKLREEDNYRFKKTVTMKEAELERLTHMLKLDPASQKRRKIRRYALAAFAVLLGIAALAWHLKENVFWTTRSYRLPYAHPSAMTVLDDEIVVADWLTQSLYYHRTDEGLTVKRVIFAPKIYFSGLAADGVRILGADRWDKRMIALGLRGGELEEIHAGPSPGSRPMGLFFDKGVLWSADPEQAKIYKHEPEGGLQISKAYSMGKLRPRAIARRGDSLYVLEDVSGKVYRNVPGPDFDKPEAWVQVTEGFESDGPRPVSMAFDDESLWILTMEPAGLVRMNFRMIGEVDLKEK